jgi:hypothetical protein
MGEVGETAGLTIVDCGGASMTRAKGPGPYPPRAALWVGQFTVSPRAEGPHYQRTPQKIDRAFSPLLNSGIGDPGVKMKNPAKTFEFVSLFGDDTSHCLMLEFRIYAVSPG